MNQPNKNDRDALEPLVERARSDPFYLGFPLTDYCRRLGWEDQTLAAHLKCPLDRMPQLFLCRCPVEDDPQFLEHVRRIADYAPCEETQLLSVLREAQAWVKLSGHATTKTNPLFLAARDRQDPKHPTDEKDGTS